MNQTQAMSMSMGPMMPMPMFVYWTADCWFLFGTWHTLKDDHGLFALGCILSFIFNIILYMLSYIQKLYFPGSLGLVKGDSCHGQLLDSNSKESPKEKGLSDILIGGLFFFLNFTMSSINMLLLMTFNGWLIICIIIGAVLGYFIGEGVIIKKKKAVYDN